MFEFESCLCLSPANCGSTKRRVDPFCSHAGRDQREQRWRRGVGSSAPGCLIYSLVDAMFKGPVARLLISAVFWWKEKMQTKSFDQEEVRASFDFSHLLIWTTLPSQLAGPSPVFLWNNTSDRAIKPQTLTWSHSHKPVVLSSTRCLKL